jgi:hypothetical protein
MADNWRGGKFRQQYQQLTAGNAEATSALYGQNETKFSQG